MSQVGSAPAMANEEATTSPQASVEDKANRVFLDFMTKVAQYDELVDAGKRALMMFHQELEHFRRPKLLTESGAISEIVKSNLSDRMRSYLEAGCTHHNENIQNMNKLHSCQEKLNDHISKAIWGFAGQSSVLCKCDGPGSQYEKIVKALCIKTTSSELEGYCQMWDLRPYIDDNVIQLAWQFVS
uniref:DUF7795 domain-containing protein n=5 Tax=Oryza TaxID=4527 RepID=A0A0E0E9Z3_9ORYZ